MNKRLDRMINLLEEVGGWVLTAWFVGMVLAAMAGLTYVMTAVGVYIVRNPIGG